jgi:hypothetical protein
MPDDIQTEPAANEMPAVRCSHTRMVPLDEMRPHPKNPNRHPQDQIALLAKVIRYHGWRHPILVSNRSGLIVAGHGRYAAATLLGCREVPVDFQDFATEADEIAYVIADNAIAELADMHGKQLESLLKSLDRAGLDAELAGIIEAAEKDFEPEAQYPIAPKMQEHYDYVVVFTTNEMDFAFLKELFDLETVQSYKKSGVGIGRAITFQKFYERIRANRDSFNVAGQQHDDAPAGA